MLGFHLGLAFDGPLNLYFYVISSNNNYFSLNITTRACNESLYLSVSLRKSFLVFLSLLTS